MKRLDHNLSERDLTALRQIQACLERPNSSPALLIRESSISKGTLDASETQARAPPQLALPEPHDGIATLTCPSLHSTITAPISRKLGGPVRGVRLRDMSAPWAPMPKTAMYEYSDT